MTGEGSEAREAPEADVVVALDPERTDRSLPALVRRRVTGRFVVDEWGYDRDVASVVAMAAGLLPGSVEVSGAERLTDGGPALVLHNRLLLPSDRLTVLAGIAAAVRRSVRFTGVPDRAPLLALARRVGGVPGDVADVRSLLRHGHLVLSPFALERRRPFGPGVPPIELVGAAMELGVPVVPLAIEGRAGGRRWRARFGAPIATRRRRAALVAPEVAETIRRRVLSPGAADHAR